MWELGGHNPDVVAAEVAYRHGTDRPGNCATIIRPRWRFWAKRRR
jgi:hypothetical protein